MNRSIWSKYVAIVVLMSCGKSSNSRLDTLENFAAEKKVVTNQCFGDPNRSPTTVAISAAQRIVNLRSDLTTPVMQRGLQTLSAVPDAALKFFMRRRGAIIVTDEVAELCSTATMKFEPDQLASCINYFAPTPQNKEILHLVISSNFNELSHGLVRAVGAALVQVLPGANPATRSGIGAFQQALTVAFLRDVSESKIFTFAGIEMLLGTPPANAKDVLLAPRSPEEILSAFDFGAKNQNERLAYRARFMDYVFSEAFDSFYCNAFGTFDEAKAKSVASGQSDLSELNEMTNSRLRMKALFPKTFEAFNSNIVRVLWMAENDEQLMRSPIQPTSVGLSLAGGPGGQSNQRSRYYRGDSESSSPWSAAAGAFFSSIYGNTVKPAVTTYQGYSQRVGTAVQNSYDSGSGFAGAVAQGVAGGAANTYKEEVYNPIAEKADKRFQGQLDGGASVNQAFYNTIGLAAGDQVGATKIAEGIGGADTEQVRVLSTGERVLKVAEGGVEAFGAVSTVSGFLPSQRALAVAKSTSTGIANRAASLEFKSVNEANEALALNQLKKSNAPAEYISKVTNAAPGRESRLTSYAAAMADDAAPSTIKKGQTVWRVVEGDIKDAADPKIFKAWASDVPPDPRLMANLQSRKQISGSLGLPDNSGNFTLVKMTAVEDIPTIKSTIAPFKTNAGTIAPGGASQQFILKEPTTISSALKVESFGDDAVKAAQQQVNSTLTRQTVTSAASGTVIENALTEPSFDSSSSDLNLVESDINEDHSAEFLQINDTVSEKDESIPDNEPKGGDASEASKENADGSPLATVTSIKGAVIYGGAPLFAGQEILHRDLLKVGMDGEVTLKLVAEDAVVTGRSGTWMKLGSAPAQVAHNVLRGETRWNRSEGSASKLPIKVSTNRESYTGIGTDFAVTSMPDLQETQVVVFSGSVDAKARSGTAHKIQPKQWGGAGGRFTNKEFRGPVKLSDATLKRLQDPRMRSGQ
jgi:hypothetical protein